LYGEFDRALQVEFLERLGNKSVRMGRFGAVEIDFIRIGGQVDDRDVVILLEQVGNFDAVALAFEVDVEQHDIGWIAFDVRNDFLATWNNACYLITQSGELQRNVRGDDHFVLYDQDFVGFGHTFGFKRLFRSWGGSLI
jgi:hypothetical protein